MDKNILLGVESPIDFKISFNKLLEQYDAMAKGDNEILADRARKILSAQSPYPILRDGFTDPSILTENAEVIELLLQDTFPEVLSQNEIKAAALPYNNIVFNHSNRLQKILADAGPDFDMKILDFSEDLYYIMAGTIILGQEYGVTVNYKKPLVYCIPDARGVNRYYRILYNVDFVELIPTDRRIELSPEDVDELLENYKDTALWKEKIPPHSYICKGFVILNMYDITHDYAVSEIKSNLIGDNRNHGVRMIETMNGIFQSLFNLPDIRFGLSLFNAEGEVFQKEYLVDVESFILGDEESESCVDALCATSYKRLIEDKDLLVISNVDKFYQSDIENSLYKKLSSQGVKSVIFAPILMEGKLYAVLEFASAKVNALHGINASILDDVLLYIALAFSFAQRSEENLIDAIIQQECTTVHSSVYWKFREVAKKFRSVDLEGGQASFEQIVFKDVYPLYGQTDIKDSSLSRNKAIQYDLLIQLAEIKNILTVVWEKNSFPIYEELIFKVDNHIEDIKEFLHTNSEQSIFEFVKRDIDPVLQHIEKNDTSIGPMIQEYKSKINPDSGSYYDHRRNYEESVNKINKKLAAVIDEKQTQAQEMYPHYFERYKTDGVEHNLYVGSSIVKGREFDMIYRNNLRLWQLQVVCEMENAHYNLKPQLALPLDVTSLILVYNTSLSISFRMDEKRFDVDGTYNARYEVIKKRIDKSYIKGSNERLTQSGKLAIVYSQKKDEVEYLSYIKFLRSKGYLGDQIELVELEGLQGVAGLKAIRVDIMYKMDREAETTYTYEDLMAHLQD
ncbi:hypothetical protein [Membranihabitans marinus]|uniref:hypothetical protein n=1 Tax=Membranihabitans marinus TaxID=1227546 RepID=UPI001F34478B|nr:hypothetical protein [Membranihabitans marinus]